MPGRMPEKVKDGVEEHDCSARRDADVKDCNREADNRRQRTAPFGQVPALDKQEPEKEDIDG